MEIGKTLYVKDRKEWRAWLKHNHKKEKEIWFVFHKKASSKNSIPYGEALDEALCFGWIDSTVKKIDEDSRAQRFTPRKKSSQISEMNKERVRKLIKSRRMTRSGLDAISKFFNPKKDSKIKFVIAKDIAEALREDLEVWKNFNSFSESYRRVRISYIEDVRDFDKEMFRKRLAYLIKMTKKNKRYGMLLE